MSNTTQENPTVENSAKEPVSNTSTTRPKTSSSTQAASTNANTQKASGTRSATKPRKSTQANTKTATSKATINIKSTKIGGAVIDQKIVSLGINIPYAQFTGGDVTNSNIEVGGDNRIKVPFIEIVRSDAPLKDGLFSAVIVDEKILNTQTGFITVDNIDLVSKAIKSEKDELISILNGGVIIK